MMPVATFLRLIQWTIVRKLRREWGRALLLIGGIALGVCMFLAIHFAADASVGAFRQSAKVLGGNFEIRPVAGSRLDDVQLSVVYPWIARVAKTSIFLEASATVVDTSEGYRSEVDGARVTITGIDPTEQAVFADAQDSLSASSRAKEAQSSGTEAYVGSQFAYAEKGTSDEIDSLCLDFGVRESCVNLRQISPEAERDVFLGKNSVVMEIGALQNAIGEPSAVSGILVEEPSGLSETQRRAWRSELAALVTELSRGQFVLEGAPERTARANKLLGAFRMNVLVMVLMTLVVCAFTVFNAAQLSVRTLLPDLSTLRTLGLSKSWMVFAVIIEAALLGSVGAIVGLTLGAPLSQATAALFLSTAETLYRVPQVSETLSFMTTPQLYFTSFLVGVSVSIIGAVLPALKVRKVVPGIGSRTVMRSAPLSISGRLLCALVLTLLGAASVVAGVAFRSDLAAHGASFAIVGTVILLSGPALLLTGRAAKRALLPLVGPRSALQILIGVNGALGSLRTSAVAVATTSCGLALLIGLGIMVESFRSTLEAWVEDSVAAEFFLSTGSDASGQAEGLSEEILGQVSALNGVAEVLRFSVRDGHVCQTPESCISLSLHVAEVRSQSDRRTYRLLAGALDLSSFTAGESALVSESAASRYGFMVGDRVTVTPQGAPPLSVTLSGVYKDFASEQGNLLLSYSALQKGGVVQTADSAAVYLNSPAPREQIRVALETLGTQAPGLKVQDQAQLRSSVFEVFDRTFRITDVLKITVILVCALGFAVTLSQLASERGKEFRTMQMLGAPSASLMAGVFFEGALLALPSVVLGILGGAVLAQLLVGVINPLSFGWTLSYIISLHTLLLPVATIMGAYLLPLGWFISRQVTMISREALSDE